MLLPYIDESAVYDAINLEADWNDPVQAPAMSTPISTYICPSDNRTSPTTSSNGVDFSTHNYPGAGSTHSYGLCGLHGTGGIFAERNGLLVELATSNAYVHQPLKLSNLVDGTSVTMAFSEFGQNMNNTNGCPVPHNRKQADIGWGQRGTGGTLFSIRREQTPNSCWGAAGSSREAAASSWHNGGVHVVFMDGHVGFVSENVDGITWERLGTFSDGNPVDSF